jgi:predicted CXXCH cytochrome family protein
MWRRLHVLQDMPRSIAARLIAAGGSIATVALLWSAGCGRPPAPGKQTAALVASGDFVGSTVCAECHAGEYEDHAPTRHAATLREVTTDQMGSLAPPKGAVPLAGYALGLKGSRYHLSREFPERKSLPLDFALGSGKLGMTFVTLEGEKTLLETRMSFFPPWRLWDITPGLGEQVEKGGDFGQVLDSADARRCMACHTTTLPKDSIRPEPRFYGVGCESCHGGGRQHIQAARAGKSGDLHMEDLAAWSPKKLNDKCGECHRAFKDIDPASVGAGQTQRFQPYALQRSACRTASGSVLSCLSCHNPHMDATKDTKSYEAVCLSCHATDFKAVRRIKDAADGKPCPVNATSGCTGCHMRPKQAFPKTAVPALMADHLISVPPKAAVKR